MKTIKLTSAAVLAAVAFGTLATTVQAADGGSYTSKGSLTYTASTSVTPPVDPEQPTDPVTPIDPTDPTKPVNPGTSGPLSIDFASSFDFGTQEITSSDKVYNAKAQKVKLADGTETTRTNYVQVTDNRGTLAGWSLSVTQKEQFAIAGASGAGAKLEGATMTLDGGNIVSNSNAPAQKFEVQTVLTPGTQSGVILGAKAGEGAGTNLLAFGDAGTKDTAVTLAVPGATTKLAQAYGTELVWTLSDTPAV